MDISKAIVAKSDQLNAADIIGQVVVTVVEVREGPDDQPVHVVTDAYGPGRPFKPSKTVLRDLGNAWGLDTDVWVGRRMRIYNDPTVLWAGQPVGGIRVSGLSHLDKPLPATHTITRGKTKRVTIDVLPDVASVTAPPTDAIPKAIAAINAATTLTKLDEIEKYATSLGIHTDTDLAATLDIKRGELSKGESA